MMHILKLNHKFIDSFYNDTERYMSTLAIEVVTISADARNWRYGTHSIELKYQILQIMSDRKLTISEISRLYGLTYGNSLPKCTLCNVQENTTTCETNFIVSLNSHENIMSNSITLNANAINLIHGTRNYLGLQIDLDYLIEYCNARRGTSRKTGEILVEASRLNVSPIPGLPYALDESFKFKTVLTAADEFKNVYYRITSVTGDAYWCNHYNFMSAQDRCYIPSCDDGIFLLLLHLAIIKQESHIMNYIDPDISGISSSNADAVYDEAFQAFASWLGIIETDNSVPNAFIVRGGTQQ